VLTLVLLDGDRKPKLRSAAAAVMTSVDRLLISAGGDALDGNDQV
jgi:hypothetical protein